MSGKCVKDEHKSNMKFSSTADIGVTENKDDYLPSVGEFMNILYRKQIFTDVTFFPNKGKESVSAHRTVLAAKCPFFEELLFGSRKNDSVGMEMKVKIGNLSFDVFRNIIEYFYTDEIAFPDVSTVIEILTGAKQFHIQPLIDRCDAYIEGIDLTEDNVCSYLHISDTKNVNALKDRCILYIEGNTDKTIKSGNFDKSTYNTVHKICNLQSFNLSTEAQLLDAIVRWVKLQPSHTQSKLKIPLLSCIRFLTLTTKDLGDAIEKHQDFLDAKDALKIMMFLNGSTAEDIESLPKWCNRSIIQRCTIERIQGKGKIFRNNLKKKIAISLIPAVETEDVAKLELTSFLQMTCRQGAHQINSLKFSFQGPPFDKSNREKVFINILVIPNNFGFRRAVEISSHEVKIDLFPYLRVKAGSIIKIQAVAKGMKSCRFLQFDEDNSPQNQHFQCTVASQPKQNRLFFITEVEYQTKQSPRSRSRNK